MSNSWDYLVICDDCGSSCKPDSRVNFEGDKLCPRCFMTALRADRVPAPRLECDTIYYVRERSNSADYTGEYVVLEHVNESGVATVRTCSTGVVFGGMRRDIPVDSVLWSIK